MRQASQLDKHLQRYAREFLETNESKSIHLDKLVKWIFENKEWEPDLKKVKRILREDLSHALSEERFTDDDFRRVRRYHFIRRKENGVQLSFAFPIEKIVRKDMQLSLQVRRRDLVSRAVQIKNDLDHYNKFVNKEEPIQMDFDLNYDVREAESDRIIPQKTPSPNVPKRPSSQSRSASSDSTSSHGHVRP